MRNMSIFVRVFGVDSIWLLSCGLFPGECLATGVVCFGNISICTHDMFVMYYLIGTQNLHGSV